jgi:hypothetical protein
MVGLGCFAFIARRMERLTGSNVAHSNTHSLNHLTPSSTNRGSLEPAETDPALVNYVRDEQITVLIQQVHSRFLIENRPF